MKIVDRLQQLLVQGVRGNQKQLVDALAGTGVNTTQSTVSRALKKINAVKSIDDNGNTVYTLPSIQDGPVRASSASDFFDSLVHDIDHNGHLIVIHTKPGTAMTVAKFIDDKRFKEVMGTVAGDDTIMVIPRNVSHTPEVANLVRGHLAKLGIME